MPSIAACTSPPRLAIDDNPPLSALVNGPPDSPLEDSSPDPLNHAERHIRIDKSPPSDIPVSPSVEAPLADGMDVDIGRIPSPDPPSQRLFEESVGDKLLSHADIPEKASITCNSNQKIAEPVQKAPRFETATSPVTGSLQISPIRTTPKSLKPPRPSLQPGKLSESPSISAVVSPPRSPLFRKGVAIPKSFQDIAHIPKLHTESQEFHSTGTNVQAGITPVFKKNPFQIRAEPSIPPPPLANAEDWGPRHAGPEGFFKSMHSSIQRSQAHRMPNRISPSDIAQKPPLHRLNSSTGNSIHADGMDAHVPENSDLGSLAQEVKESSDKISDENQSAFISPNHVTEPKAPLPLATLAPAGLASSHYSKSLTEVIKQAYQNPHPDFIDLTLSDDEDDLSKLPAHAVEEEEAFLEPPANVINSALQLFASLNWDDEESPAATAPGKLIVNQYFLAVPFLTYL